MNGTNQNQSLGKSELRYYFIRLTIYQMGQARAMSITYVIIIHYLEGNLKDAQ